MIDSFEEFIKDSNIPADCLPWSRPQWTNEAKTIKGTKIFQFADRFGNFLTNLCNEYSDIDPDTVDLRKFAQDIFKQFADCSSVFVSEIDYRNDEVVQKVEINRNNPLKTIEL